MSRIYTLSLTIDHPAPIPNRLYVWHSEINSHTGQRIEHLGSLQDTVGRRHTIGLHPLCTGWLLGDIRGFKYAYWGVVLCLRYADAVNGGTVQIPRCAQVHRLRTGSERVQEWLETQNYEAECRKDGWWFRAR